MSSGAPTLSATRLSTASTSGSCMTVTAGTPCLKIPAFSSAILASVLPSWAMWSLLMLGDGGHFGLDDVGAVEPAAQAGLDDGDIDLLLGEVLERDGGQDVEVASASACIAATIGSTSRTSRAKSACGIISPLIWMRSRMSTRCGLV